MWNIAIGAAIKLAPRAIGAVANKFPQVGAWLHRAKDLPLIGRFAGFVANNPNKTAFGAGFLTTEGSVWDKAKGGLGAASGSLLFSGAPVKSLFASLIGTPTN